MGPLRLSKIMGARLPPDCRLRTLGLDSDNPSGAAPFLAASVRHRARVPQSRRHFNTPADWSGTCAMTRHWCYVLRSPLPVRSLLLAIVMLMPRRDLPLAADGAHDW